VKRYGLHPELVPAGDSVVFGAQGETPQEWVLAGRLSEYGRRYAVKLDVSKEKVIAIFGKRGQGKSYTLGSLLESMCPVEQQSTISHVAGDRAVLLFDTLDIFQWMNVPLDGRWRDRPQLDSQARLLDGWDIRPEPLRIQIWAPADHDPTPSWERHRVFRLHVPDLRVDDWGSLLGVDIMRDIMGQYLFEVFHKVTRTGWTDKDDNTHRGEPHYHIADLLDCIENDLDSGEGVYRQDTRRAVLQRLRAYQAHPLFSGEGTPLRELLTPGVASVLLLNRLSEDLRSVLVSVVVRRILRERSEASAAAKDLMINPHLSPDERAAREKCLVNAVPKCWVVIDEAQNVVPAGKPTFASESIVKLVKEGRNFGLSFVVTTQQPKAIDQSILSQVETFIVHKLVTLADIRFVLENVKCPMPDEILDEQRQLSMSDLILSLSVGQAVVSDTEAPRSFVMEVRPRVSAHGGFEA
jgi:DNA helicase HerA-like ATPase